MADWVAGGDKGYAIRVSAYPLHQNYERNHTVVRLDIFLRTPAITFVGNVGVTANINGGQQHQSFGVNSPAYNSEIYLGTFDFTVNHNNDGTQGANINVTATCSNTSFGFAGAISTGVRGLPLPTIPRASVPIGDKTAVLGQPITISVERKSNNHYDVLWLRMGSYNEIILNNIRGSGTWTPPMELARQFTNSREGVGSLTLITYRDGSPNELGRSVSQLRVSIPDSEKPVISEITVEEQQSQCKAMLNNSKYVQIMSEIKVAVPTYTTKYGATMPNDNITVSLVQAGKVITEQQGSDIIFRNITVSGDVAVKATIRDSRGLLSEPFTKTITIDPYFPPVVSCKVDRRPDNQKKLRLILNARTSILLGSDNTNKNGGRRVIEVRNTRTNQIIVDTSGDYASPFGIADVERIVDLAKDYDTGSSFIITVTVTDGFGKVGTYTVPIGTIKVHQTDDPFGIGINKVRERGALDVLGDVYVNNKQILPHEFNDASGNAVWKDNADANLLTSSGIYRGRNIKNTPPGIDALVFIRVISNNANYLVQELFTFNGEYAGIRHKIGVDRWTPWRSIDTDNAPIYTQTNVPIGWGLKATLEKRGRVVNFSFEGVATINQGLDTAKMVEKIPTGFRPLNKKTVFAYRNMGANVKDPALYTIDPDGSIYLTQSNHNMALGFRGSASWIAEPTPPVTGGANAQVRR